MQQLVAGAGASSSLEQLSLANCCWLKPRLLPVLLDGLLALQKLVRMRPIDECGGHSLQPRAGDPLQHAVLREAGWETVGGSTSSSVDGEPRSCLVTQSVLQGGQAGDSEGLGADD